MTRCRQCRRHVHAIGSHYCPACAWENRWCAAEIGWCLLLAVFIALMSRP